MGWCDCLFNAAPVVAQYRGAALAANVDALAVALAGEAMIRLYVDRGGGTGQQAAAVNLLKRIIAPRAPAPVPGLQYTGAGKRCEIIYDDGFATTLPNLQRQLNLGGAMQGVFQGLQVELFALSAVRLAPPRPHVRFSFSGATDGNAEIRFDAICFSAVHLRLQPFMYGRPELLLIAGQPTINLTTRPEVGGAAFAQLGFYLPVPVLDPAAWAGFLVGADAAQTRRIGVLRALIDGQFAAGPGGAKLYELLFTYGIHTLLWRDGTNAHVSAIGDRPTDQVVQLALGAMATQVNRQGVAVAGALPCVIVNLDDFWYDDKYFQPADRAARVDIFRKVIDLLGGGLAANEPDPAAPQQPGNALRQQRLQVVAARRAYLAAVGLGVGANVGLRFTALDDPTAVNAGAAVAAMLVAANATRRVLWIQLAPPLPPPLFGALIGSGSLPALFEGNNTANQALAFPRMYYNAARPGEPGVRYPSLVLAARPGEATLRTLQQAANQVGKPLDGWPRGGNGSDAPPEVFAGPIRAWRAEPPAGPYRSYFTNVSNFFRQIENDKFSLAFALMGEEFLGGNMPLLLARADAQRTGEPALLAGLYAALAANLNATTLTLLPGALASTGKIASFLSAVFGLTGTSWTLTSAAIATEGGTPPPDQGGSITVTGNFSLSDLALAMTAVFTVGNGALEVHVEVAGAEPPPALPGLQWAPFKSCTMVFDIANSRAIPVAQVQAVLQWPGSSDTFDVTWPLTLTDGALKLTGNFNPPLSIDYAFKLAGGVNLLPQVPPPFSALTGLGVTGLELGYDRTTSSANFVSVLVSYTGAPVPLFSVLSLDSLSMILSVSSPGDPVARKAQAAIQSQFKLGGGTIQIGAQLPDMVFRGELSDGQIALSDLISFFTLGVVITPDTPAAVDNLGFEYDVQAGTGALSVNLNADWSIRPAGIPALTIESLSLAVQIDKSQPPGSQYAGRLSGGFTLLSGTSTEVGLQVAAAWDPAAGWQLTARQTSGTLMLLAFITTYLGGQFTFSHDLALSGIELTLAPGVKGSIAPSYGFKLQTAAPLSVDFLGLSIPKVTAEIGYVGPVASASAAAKTLAAPREAPPPIRGLPLSAAARANYRRRAKVRRARTAGAAMDITDVGDGQQGLSGSIGGQVKWFGITLDVTYDFQKPAAGQSDQKVTLDIILDDQPFASASVERKSGKTKATFEFGQDTLGGVVETFVSWATGQRFSLGAPWDLLDSIPLDRFQVIFDFDSKTVDFSWGIGPITIGPAVIRSIDLNYQTATQSSPSKVWVTLNGTFPWQPGDDTLKWDAADPTSTQAPPGGGNKYFDLRLLALGQHLALTSSGRIDHVAPLIEALSSLVPPDGKGVPVPLVSDQLKLDYAAYGGWLVAADFGILKIGDDDPDAGDGYVVQFSAVFNDPVLYGARIALAGKAAKIFAGLQFEIIYQQVSATAGVWRARIALPTVLRTFEAGAVTITLPEFGIGIYTNGDFEVDVGFPWNMDFSVSFTVAAIIPPGIPVLGSGGFYFAKLSDATKSQVPPGTSVPAAINGTFNPIICFGFGAQFGLGKSLSMGVLQAGFSLTAFGILQGVLAKWHPYDGSGSGPGGSTELQGQYYFQLAGTFGLIGKLYGSLDFVIVSASLDIDINLYVQIGYTSYQPIVISAVASVDVQLTVSINLGLFSIHIHFGFSATVKATFELQVGSSTAPWEIAPPIGPASLLHAPPQMRLFASSHGLLANTTAPVWKGKLADTAPSARPGLTGQFVPTLTATGDAATLTADQQACYVALLLLDAPGPVTSGTPQPDSDGSAFEKLCRLVGAWVGASVQADNGVPLASLWSRPVTEQQLKAVVDSLSGDNPFPISLDAIESFLAGQVAVTITVPPPAAPSTAPKGVVFPPPPNLRLQAPGIDYSFGGLTTTDPSYLSDLKALFNRLAVQVEKEQQGAAPRLEALAATGPSIAGFVYAAWFALLARQLTNAMLQGLRNFQYDPKANAGGSLAAMLADLNSQLGTPGAVNAATLLVANPRHPLNGGKRLQVTGAPLTAGASETFAAIAARAFSPPSGAYFDGQSLADLNPQAPLVEGAAFTLNGAPQTTIASDTLTKLAHRLTGGVVSTLLSSSNVAAQVPLVTGAALTAPAFAYATSANDVFEDLARRFSVGVETFAVDANVNAVSGLFLFDATANRFLAAPHLTTASVQALVDEAQRSGAFRHASGMLSRFMLHGLRLQAAGKVTPTAPALFVTGKPGSYAYTVDEAGLYVLTGQQFALPTPFLPSYQVTLSQAARTWLTLGTANGLSAVFKVSDYGGPQPEQARVANLQGWLARNILDVGVTAIGPEPAIAQAPASYSVTSASSWLNLGRVTLPSGGDVAANAGLTLIQLPGELSALAAQTVTVTSADGSRKVVSPNAPPAFELTLQRYDQATGQTVPQPVGASGWASLVTLSIRRDAGSNAAADTYELIGAGEADIQVLERLLEAIGDSDATLAGLAVLYPSGAKATPGLISDDFADVRTGLIQSNLTTVTLPPSGSRGALELAQAPAPWSQVYNPTIAQFLRFVWEASITRSGGFYLYYYDMARKAGLPDAMFNDQGEGKVNLLVVHRNPAAVPAYVNCAVLGQGIAGKDLAVTAMASQPKASVSLIDTLDAIGLHAYLPASSVAEQLAGQALVDGKVLSVGGGLYQVVTTTPSSTQPGCDPGAIAKWFRTDVAALKAANPDAPPGWWTGGVPLLNALRLPLVAVTSSAASGWGSLSSIAGYWRTTVAQLGVDNRSVPGLFANGAATVTTGPVAISPIEPPGVVGYLAQRPIPADPTDAPSLMASLFTMLGYAVAANQDFVRVPALPAGPRTGGSVGKGKLRAAVATGDNTWRYRLTVPTYRCVPGWKPGNDNPYSALGKVLQIDLRWQDLFGNRLLGPAASVPIGPSCYNLAPAMAGYTDRLIGVGGWPSITTTWAVAKAGVITLSMSFNLARYQAGNPPPSPLPDYRTNAARDLAVYQQIARQLADPNGVAWSLQTSLDASGSLAVPPAMTAAVKALLVTIQAYLEAIAAGQPPANIPAAFNSFDVPIATRSQAQVSSISMAFVLARNAALVAGAAHDAPGVANAVTALAPAIDANADGTSGMATSLAQFATAFEAAMSDSGATVKLAVGPDRYAGRGPQQMWAVRMARTPATGIGFQLAPWTAGQSVTPMIYARRPMSRVLASRPGVPVWLYDGKSILDPGSTAYTSLDFSQIDTETWGQAFAQAFDRVLTPPYAAPALVVDARAKTKYLQRLRGAKTKVAGALSKLVIPVFKQVPAPLPAQAQLDAQEAMRQTLLEQLSNAFAADVVVQFPVAVQASLNEPAPPNAKAVPPRLFGGVGFVNADPTATLTATSAKIDLVTAPAAAPELLTFLVTTGFPAGETPPAYVPVGAGQGAFAGSNIEHQIGSLSGIVGYEASSWLSFPVPLQGDLKNPPLAAAVFPAFDVPVIVRAYPPNPHLDKQLGKHTQGDQSDLRQARAWSYEALFSRDSHPPQDRLKIDITFNHPASASAHLLSLLGAAPPPPPPPDSFSALAEFTAAYPKIAADLDANLLPIDPQASDGAIDQASLALGSFVALAEYVAQGLANEFGGTAVGKVGLGAGPDYAFELFEGDVPLDVYVLVINAQQPPDIGTPSVELPGFDTLLCTGVEKWTPPLYKARIQAGTAFAYAFKATGSPPAAALLNREDGRQVRGRTIVLPGLDVLARQNALMAVSVSRNPDLVPGMSTADPFVYATPPVAFTAPLRPTVTDNRVLRIDKLCSGVTVTTLRAQLQALWDGLFAGAPLSNTIQCSVQYVYGLGPSGLQAVSLPVLMLPSTTFTLPPATAAGDEVSESGLLDALTAAVHAWFVCNLPAAGSALVFDAASQSWLSTPGEGSGVLVLDLVVMGAAGGVPLLELPKLTLPIESVSPPLHTS